MSLALAVAFVVFAVHPDPDGPFIAPIAFVEHGRFSAVHKPYETTEREEEVNKAFRARYYRKGARYRVLSGGVESGVAKVREIYDADCDSPTARVSLTQPVDGGIAVASLALPLGKTAPREPTEDEYKKLYEVAGRVFARNGVSPSLFDQMESGRVVATDINDDGQIDYIGDFEITDKTRKVEHRLFLILTGLTPDYVWYHRGNLAVEKDVTLITFVDHAHFGGSAFDQVIVKLNWSEGWGYRILQRDRTGKWKVVYEGSC